MPAPGISRYQVRPPIRPRASTTTTLRPASRRSRAAAIPANPPPTTSTSASIRRSLSPYHPTVLRAAGWAGLAASTLLVGAWFAIAFRATDRALGLVMGFGAGALIA